MMKYKFGMTAITVYLIGGLSLMGATLPTSDSRDTLITQQSLDNLSIGGVFEVMKRDMKFDNGTTTKLEARNYYGYIGYDFFQRLTLFGTIGACQAKSSDYDSYENGKVKWSAGLNLKIWHYDIYDPSFIAGRCSFRAMGEYSQYQSGELNAVQYKWQDLFATVNVNYEIFVGKMEDTDQYPYSLLMYVGPAYSKVNGKKETLADSQDFSEVHNIGVAGGVDVFASHNLSIGGQVQYFFDDVTLSGSLMYNF